MAVPFFFDQSYCGCGNPTVKSYIELSEVVFFPEPLEVQSQNPAIKMLSHDRHFHGTGLD